jgi:hypothetical protein
MNKLCQSEGATAYERFCNYRKLNGKRTSTIYEFAAFIDYGLGTIKRNMKHPGEIEVPVNAHTKHTVNLLNSEHGEMLLKAMIIRKYSGFGLILMKLKKYYYFFAAFIMGVYYDMIGGS